MSSTGVVVGANKIGGRKKKQVGGETNIVREKPYKNFLYRSLFSEAV